MTWDSQPPTQHGTYWFYGWLDGKTDKEPVRLLCEVDGVFMNYPGATDALCTHDVKGAWFKIDVLRPALPDVEMLREAVDTCPIGDIGALQTDLEQQDWQDDPDDEYQEIRSIFFGTVMGSTPSGKYYLPFACSNVDPCPVCKGQGTVLQPQGDQGLHYALESMSLHVRTYLMLKYGPACENKWPKEAEEILRNIVLTMAPHAKRTTCPACEGLGSREALLDQLWWEIAENKLAEIDAYIHCGEGCATDIFISQRRDKENE